MARSYRPTTATPLALALAALAACSAGGGPGGRGPDDDPRGVNERVRALVQRFTYGDAGPYEGPAGDGNVFGGESSGGPFEGADLPGVIGPPAAAAGAYERSGPCDAYCTFAAGCLGVPVPSSCAGACGEAVGEVVRSFGEDCAAPLLEIYTCVADVLICDRDPRFVDEEGDVTIRVDADALERCAGALDGLRACTNQPNFDLGDLFDDDDDDDDDEADPPNGDAAPR
ncbi:MAG TPA: hypothetical protein VFS43_26055 [Polyangiaceae bacterium]|nr:hypothetical protein [Polyangiaceae bacterium]